VQRRWTVSSGGCCGGRRVTAGHFRDALPGRSARPGARRRGVRRAKCDLLDHAGASSTRATRIGIGHFGVKVEPEPEVGIRGRPPDQAGQTRLADRPGPATTVQPGMSRLANRDGRRAPFRPRLRTQRANPAPFAGQALRAQPGEAWHTACGRTGVRVRWVASHLRACHHRAAHHPSNSLSAPRDTRGPGASWFGMERRVTARDAPAGRSPSRALAPSRTSRAVTGPRPVRAACRAGRQAARAGAPRCPGAPRPSADR